MSHFGSIGSKPVVSSQTPQQTGQVDTSTDKVARRLAVLAGHLTQSAPESAPPSKPPKALTVRLSHTSGKSTTAAPKKSMSSPKQTYASVTGKDSVRSGNQNITLASKDTLASLWETYQSDPHANVSVLLTDIHSGRSGEVSVPIEKAIMLRQAINDFTQLQLKKTEGGLTIPHDPSLPNKQEFDKGCSHLVGKDYLPKAEELRVGHDIFENARGSSSLTFGLTRDVNDTIAFGHGGYTSETNKGAVFMPREWTLFLNDCWVMGGIKGEVPFTGITIFSHLGGGESPDFSSKGQTGPKPTPSSEGVLDVPSMYVVTVSVVEITALREAGYQPVPDETFGVRYVPDPELGKKRSDLTFSDLVEIRANCVLTQAAEHITGDYAQVRSLLEFVQQQKPSDSEVSHAQDKLKTLYKDSSISPKSSDNAIARRQIKMHDAARQLRILTDSSISDPLKAISLAPKHPEGPLTVEQQDRAWRELQHSGSFILDNLMSKVVPTGIPPQSARLLKLEFLRQTEEARIAIEDGSEDRFSFGTTKSIANFLIYNEESYKSLDEDEQSMMLAFLREGVPTSTKNFATALDSEPVQSSFDKLALQRGYTKAQRDHTFGVFEGEAMRRYQRGALKLDAFGSEPDRFFSVYDRQATSQAKL